MSQAPYKMFFKRNIGGGVDGLLTVMHNDGRSFFKQMQARTGQSAGYKTSWQTGISGTPVGTHLLHIQPKSPFVEQIGQDAGQTGIGEFFRISSTHHNIMFIDDPHSNRRRKAVGLHQENKWAGSRGCVVVVVDTPEQMAEWRALSAFLLELGETYDYMPIEVFY